MLAALANVAAFTAPPRFAAPMAAAAVSRGGVPLAQDLSTETAAAGVQPLVWNQTPSGFKYIDDLVGAGEMPDDEAVVQVHYTVTLLSSGTTLGTSRDGQPLTFAVGKHNIPIWDEALKGMRVGGKRRMLVPPTAIPESQAERVPGENRVLRFDFELIKALDPKEPLALIASTFPPNGRPIRLGQLLYTVLFALSFIPYFLPYNMQPEWYHDGTPPDQIQQHREQRMNSRYLGGDINKLDELFPQ